MMPDLLYIFIFSGLTILIYQLAAKLQKLSQKVWLNPMLLSIAIIIPLLLAFKIEYQLYASNTSVLSRLLEPAVVALGFPLYQHLATIKRQWFPICLTLATATLIALVLNYLVTIKLIALPEVAVSLSLKSITTPIGLALTQQLNGNEAITAIAIIIAGLVGAVIGMKWLSFIGIHSTDAQGLAIGTASHALGTATISQISYRHAAYSSVALILSAIFTAIMSPVILPFLQSVTN